MKLIDELDLPEPNAGSDAAAIETTAVLKGDHWIINGTNIFITNGAVADVLVVVAQTDKSKRPRGISNFIIKRGMPGLSQLEIPGMVGFGKEDSVILDSCYFHFENKSANPLYTLQVPISHPTQDWIGYIGAF